MYQKLIAWDFIFIFICVIYLISSKHVHYPREIRIIISGIILLVSIFRAVILFYSKKK